MVSNNLTATWLFDRETSTIRVCAMLGQQLQDQLAFTGIDLPQLDKTRPCESRC